MEGAFVTYVWTDGCGMNQARCQHCDHRSRWYRDPEKAADKAREHGAAHAGEEELAEYLRTRSIEENAEEGLL